MTSSTLRPAQLDLATLNATQSVVTKALESKVCEWEFAADLAVHAASMAIGALFLETLDTFAIVEDIRTIQLPDLGTTDKDRALDALQVEVASHQPCPTV